MIRPILKNLVEASFFAIFITLFIFLLLFQSPNKLIYIVSFIILLAILFLAIKIIEKINISFKKGIFFVIVLISIIFQLICAYYLILNLNINHADFDFLVRSAQEYAKHGIFSSFFNEYINRYSNNQFYVFFLIFIYKFLLALGANDSILWWSGILIGVICINATIISIGLVCKNLWGVNIGLLSYIVASLCLPFYLIISTYYTDLLSLPFVSLGLLYLSKLIKTYTRKESILVCMKIGIFFGIASLFKITALIILFAIFLFIILLNNDKKRINNLLVICSSFLFTFFTAMAILKYSGIFDFTHYNSDHFPLTHWIMMGLNSNGTGFIMDDYQLTYNQPTIMAKEVVNLAVIKQRIVNFGFCGLLNHFGVKICNTWTDGLFGINFAFADILHPSRLLQFVMKSGKYHYITELYSQSYFALMIFLMAVSGYNALINKKDNFIVILRLSILGLFIFLLVWESKPRYLFNFLPLMIIVAIDGFQSLRVFILNRIRDLKLDALHVSDFQ